MLDADGDERQAGHQVTKNKGDHTQWNKHAGIKWISTWENIGGDRIISRSLNCFLGKIYLNDFQ